MVSEMLQSVEWSRAQFALTAIYHWLFVPLTLGLSVLCALMETRYYRTGDPFWRSTTKFWMRLFGINFAIGVATGLFSNSSSHQLSTTPTSWATSSVRRWPSRGSWLSSSNRPSWR